MNLKSKFLLTLFALPAMAQKSGGLALERLSSPNQLLAGQRMELTLSFHNSSTDAVGFNCKKNKSAAKDQLSFTDESGHPVECRNKPYVALYGDEWLPPGEAKEIKLSLICKKFSGNLVIQPVFNDCRTRTAASAAMPQIAGAVGPEILLNAAKLVIPVTPPTGETLAAYEHYKGWPSDFEPEYENKFQNSYYAGYRLISLPPVITLLPPWQPFPGLENQLDLIYEGKYYEQTKPYVETPDFDPRDRRYREAPLKAVAEARYQAITSLLQHFPRFDQRLNLERQLGYLQIARRDLLAAEITFASLAENVESDKERILYKQILAWIHARPSKKVRS